MLRDNFGESLSVRSVAGARPSSMHGRRIRAPHGLVDMKARLSGGFHSPFERVFRRPIRHADRPSGGRSRCRRGSARRPGSGPGSAPRRGSAQPNTAAAMASRKITRDEKVAGRRPSAMARSPWPPAWLTRPWREAPRCPAPVCGITRVSKQNRDDEEDGGGDQAGLEGDPRGAGRLPAPCSTARKYMPKKKAVATP